MVRVIEGKINRNDLKRNKNYYYFELLRGSSQKQGLELLESTVIDVNPF